MFIFALVLGVVLLPISIWLYRGNTPKARFWLTQNGFVDERGVIFYFPALTMVFLGMGTAQLWSLIIRIESLPALLYALTGISFAVAIFGFIWFMWGLLRIPFPQKFRPRYLRELEAAGRYFPNALGEERLISEDEARRRAKRAERNAKKAQKQAEASDGKYGEKAPKPEEKDAGESK